MIDTLQPWNKQVPCLFVVQKRVLQSSEVARGMDVVFGDDDVYEVLVDNTDHHAIDLKKNRCDYGN